MYRSYQIRPDIIDTEPGASALCPFSPPPDFVGGGEEYTALMRQRYKLDARYLAGRICHFQTGGPLEIVGPFAEQARAILSKLAAQRNEKKAG
jgi:hypothetical protein